MSIDETKAIKTDRNSSGIPVWEHMDLRPEELLEKKDWNNIIKYASDNKDLLYDKWLRENRTELNKSLNAGSFYMAYITEVLTSLTREYAVFELGALHGMINLLGNIVYHEEQEEDSLNIAQKELSSIKHLNDIILLLESNGTLTHSSLAEKLDHMNASTLTENMKKIISRKLVFAQIYGKFKQYYLTDYGRAYAKLLRKKETEGISIREIEEGIKTLLKSRENFEVVQEMLNRITSFMSEVNADETFEETKLIKNDFQSYTNNTEDGFSNYRWREQKRRPRRFKQERNHLSQKNMHAMNYSSQKSFSGIALLSKS